MGLKKETGGTKVEPSHEKKPEDAKHKGRLCSDLGLREGQSCLAVRDDLVFFCWRNALVYSVVN